MAPRPGRAPRPLAPRARWLLWMLALAAATLAMLAVRPRLDKAHVALVFLLVVLGGSAAAGRALGIALALAAFVCFNVLFIPPYHGLGIADPLDWLVLVAFLATGIVAAQLLDRARTEAAAARRRAAEVDRLAALGAESLSVPRAEDALVAIARMIATTLDVAECALFLREPGTDRLAAAHDHGGEGGGDGADARARGEALAAAALGGRVAVELADGGLRTTPDLPAAYALAAGRGDVRPVRAIAIPLAVRDRLVGVLRLADARGVTLDPRRQRFLEALAYYAALGAERVRLAAEAERSAALREADRVKDALLAGVSHDLRTPLTTIRALAHEIAADGDERALSIEEEVVRLDRFVADLLDLSRLTAGAMPVALELNAADDLLGAVLQRVAGMARGREIRASVAPGEPVLVGRFDFTHALRILGNLLENALKYAPPAQPVELTAAREDGMLCFRVADRGPGVARGEEARIFDGFHRPPGTAPDVGGTGLGLAIAQRLARAQGGAVDYQPRDGGGSVFTLRLPAADLSQLAD